MRIDEAEFRRRFAGTPLERPKRRGLLRNVAVALGNWGDPASLPALTDALIDPEPLVRGHAAWALGRIRSPEARESLRSRLTDEDDPWVREELEFALGN